MLPSCVSAGRTIARCTLARSCRVAAGAGGGAGTLRSVSAAALVVVATDPGEAPRAIAELEESGATSTEVKTASTARLLVYGEFGDESVAAGAVTSLRARGWPAV